MTSVAFCLNLLALFRGEDRLKHALRLSDGSIIEISERMKKKSVCMKTCQN